MFVSFKRTQVSTILLTPFPEIFDVFQCELSLMDEDGHRVEEYHEHQSYMVWMSLTSKIHCIEYMDTNTYQVCYLDDWPLNHISCQFRFLLCSFSAKRWALCHHKDFHHTIIRRHLKLTNSFTMNLHKTRTKQLKVNRWCTNRIFNNIWPCVLKCYVKCDLYRHLNCCQCGI